MTTNELDLAAIEARVDAATKGPWTTGVRWEEPVDVYWLPINSPSTNEDDPHQPDRVALIRYQACGFQFPHYDALSDAAFIANARQDVPALVAEVRKLREQLFAQKPVIAAVEAWAEKRELDNGFSIKTEDALHDAVEQYRLMDHALTTARDEQPEVTR